MEQGDLDKEKQGDIFERIKRARDIVNGNLEIKECDKRFRIENFEEYYRNAISADKEKEMQEEKKKSETLIKLAKSLPKPEPRPEPGFSIIPQLKTEASAKQTLFQDIKLPPAPSKSQLPLFTLASGAGGTVIIGSNKPVETEKIKSESKPVGLFNQEVPPSLFPAKKNELMPQTDFPRTEPKTELRKKAKLDEPGNSSVGVLSSPFGSSSLFSNKPLTNKPEEMESGKDSLKIQEGNSLFGAAVKPDGLFSDVFKPQVSTDKLLSSPGGLFNTQSLFTGNLFSPPSGNLFNNTIAPNSNDLSKSNLFTNPGSLLTVSAPQSKLFTTNIISQPSASLFGTQPSASLFGIQPSASLFGIQPSAPKASNSLFPVKEGIVEGIKSPTTLDNPQKIEGFKPLTENTPSILSSSSLFSGFGAMNPSQTGLAQSSLFSAKGSQAIPNDTIKPVSVLTNSEAPQLTRYPTLSDINPDIPKNNVVTNQPKVSGFFVTGAPFSNSGFGQTNANEFFEDEGFASDSGENDDAD